MRAPTTCCGRRGSYWSPRPILATCPELSDFFDRVYRPCLDRTVRLPYGLVVKGDTDVEGAVASVERIATGLRWRQVLPPVTVVGAIGPDDEARAAELGATLAAGLAAGIF